MLFMRFRDGPRNQVEASHQRTARPAALWHRVRTRSAAPRSVVCGLAPHSRPHHRHRLPWRPPTTRFAESAPAAILYSDVDQQWARTAPAHLTARRARPPQGDMFRTTPLWGVASVDSSFHDGRTSDLLGRIRLPTLPGYVHSYPGLPSLLAIRFRRLTAGHQQFNACSRPTNRRFLIS